MSNGFIDLPQSASIRWKAPVSNFASLPNTGNGAGDARVTLNNQFIYVWSGSAWTLTGGGAGADFPHNTNIVDMTGGTGSVVASLANSQLLGGGGQVRLDWNSQTLVNSGTAVCDWSQMRLQTGTSTSVDWGNYWLVASSGNTSVDYGARVLKDGDSSVVMDWNGGFLTIPGGSPTVAWEAYALHGSSGFVTVAWDAFHLTNNFNQTTVDWGARVLSANFGSDIAVLDWENLLLLDSGSITSLDWGNNRTTYDSNGIQSVGWGARNLFNTSGVIVTDFNNLQLFDAASVKTMDWGQRYLYNSANQILGNWNTGILQDTTPITSLDWLNRILYDSSNNQSLNYQSRILKDTASGNSINYGTRSFYDTAGAVAANYNNNLATLKASGFSLTAQRVTATNAGSYTVQVSAAAVIVHIASGATIASYTLTLPASTNLVDGQRYDISTDGAITALTLTAGSGTTVVPSITTLTKSFSISLIYDQALTQWVSAGTNNTILSRNTTAVSATVASGSAIYAVTDTTSVRTVTLPAASAYSAGQVLIIKDESGGANSHNITISRAGSDTIDGATSASITANYGVVRLYSNGSNSWFSI